MTEDLCLSPEDAALLVRVIKDAPVVSFLEQEARGRLLERIQSHAKLVPAPLNGDKVWMGRVCWPRCVVDDGSNHNQMATIVRAKTRAEAVRLLIAAGDRISVTHFRDYWSEAGSREALATATERGVWAQGKEGWVKLWPK